MEFMKKADVDYRALAGLQSLKIKFRHKEQNLTFKICPFDILKHGNSVLWALSVGNCLIQCQRVQIHGVIQIRRIMNYL